MLFKLLYSWKISLLHLWFVNYVECEPSNYDSFRVKQGTTFSRYIESSDFSIPSYYKISLSREMKYNPTLRHNPDELDSFIFDLGSKESHISQRTGIYSTWKYFKRIGPSILHSYLLKNVKKSHIGTLII